MLVNVRLNNFRFKKINSAIMASLF